MEAHHILTIDQGTTSSRALIFDTRTHKIVALAQQEFKQYYPHNGWVEHDGEEIWETTLAVIREVLQKAKVSAKELAGIGITNQRETTVVWEQETGRLVYPAIVWQDRRTTELCETLKADGLEEIIHQKTGLYLDPYFCATKINWILEHVANARRRGERGALLFGTIDSFLIWRLTRGLGAGSTSAKAVHISDETNASRTSLYNIHTHTWDDELLKIFNVPRAMLPRVVPSSTHFGETHESLLGVMVPILGVAGDQQSSLFGHGCLTKGMMKSTYGTGAFLLVHTGDRPLLSKHKLLTTCACRLEGAPVQYAVEGAIFIAGALLKWFKENLHFLKNYAESGDLAAQLTSNEGLYIVPSFSGLGAPYWNARARGAMFGLTRATTQAHIVRAGLESIAFQTHDLIEALIEDGIKPTSLRVDGGLAASDWLLQFIVKLSALAIVRPAVLETTALGATYLAALQSGLYKDTTVIEKARTEVAHFNVDAVSEEEWTEAIRREYLKKWKKAVRAVTLFATED